MTSLPPNLGAFTQVSEARLSDLKIEIAQLEDELEQSRYEAVLFPLRKLVRQTYRIQFELANIGTGLGYNFTSVRSCQPSKTSCSSGVNITAVKYVTELHVYGGARCMSGTRASVLRRNVHHLCLRPARRRLVNEGIPLSETKAPYLVRRPPPRYNSISIGGNKEARDLHQRLNEAQVQGLIEWPHSSC